MIDHTNLEEFADPVLYDLEQTSRGAGAIAFYCALAQETGAPVLELACGTGRVAIPIAQQGAQVIGIDLVPGMLGQARQKSAGLPVHWIVGDMRHFHLALGFRLIFLTGNAFQALLTRPAQAAMLACVRTHLHEAGVLAFDTRNPRPAALRTTSVEEPWWTYTDPQGHTVQVTGRQHYDHVSQIMHWTTSRRWQVGAAVDTRVTRIATRYVFPQELEALLHYNGFTIVRQYGDWEGERLTAESPRMITVCQKAES
jgi:SAM-dependent methyltransferase